MLNDWLTHCLALARSKADGYMGCRKIIRTYQATFNTPSSDLTIADAGFTKTKLTLLRKLYYHDESIQAAVAQWDRCLSRRKYSSASFHCYNHYLKNDPTKKSKRASVMGPCLQSVCLTWWPHAPAQIDVFYRTTEIFKKFPADLVFIRDQLLPNFKLDDGYVLQFHFANVTCHPMYFVTLIPHLPRWETVLDEFKGHDRRFFDWTIKWTARYVCEEYTRGIEKFAQAMRVRKDAMSRIKPKRLKALQDYCRDNHPGYRDNRNRNGAPDDDDD